ncbi:unnamed protein product [Protopolystoma xenopodis]|uniref:Uncharacterized protein n=1 Tax=Protopolystoma xenopodis TaxID=117903 RepID=A0A448X3X3_9PLAT|nr:unnamed protein product [Protopolystoma xenopodis]
MSILSLHIGVQPSECHFSKARFAEFRFLPPIFSVLRAVADLRQAVRTFAQSVGVNANEKLRLMKLCDNFRDDGLASSGVRLQDKSWNLPSSSIHGTTTLQSSMQRIEIPAIGLYDTQWLAEEVADRKKVNGQF